MVLNFFPQIDKGPLTNKENTTKLDQAEEPASLVWNFKLQASFSRYLDNENYFSLHKYPISDVRLHTAFDKTELTSNEAHW